MKAREHHSEIVNRVPRLQIFFAVCMVGIAAAFWVVQVVHGARYRELAENNSLRKRVIKAPRGLIFERGKRPLVENVASYNLLLHPGRSADLEASRAFAESVLGELSEAAMERWERPWRSVSVIRPFDRLPLASVLMRPTLRSHWPLLRVQVPALR